MLVLQIALGIVLGVLILRYLGHLIAIIVAGAVVAAVIVVAVLGWSIVRNHWDTLAPIGGGIAVCVVIACSVQLAARGLGYLFVRTRHRITLSRRWVSFVEFLGVERGWLTSNQSSRDIARSVGDRLLVGAAKLIFGYFVASMLLIALEATVVESAFNSTRPALTVSLVIVAVLLPGVALYFWIGRRGHLRKSALRREERRRRELGYDDPAEP